MGVTETLMGENQFSIPLRPGTPRAVLDDIDIRNNLWSSIVITPHHLRPDELGANLFANARFAGVLLEQGADGSLSGDGLEWWLGNSGDGGSLSVGIDTTHSGRDLEDHLDNDVFGASNAISNGIAKGSVNANATTFSFAEEGGDTPREILDTLAAAAPGGPYLWRINPNATLDVDLQANLWPSTDAPAVILADEGGRESGIDGLQTSLRLEALNGREVRTAVYVDWQDGVDNGISTPSLPATYTTPVGGTPRVRHYMDWRPKRPKPPTERWRKVAPWRVKSQTRANQIAVNDVRERTYVRPEITAEVEEYDPHRFDITPGDTVYLWAPEQRLYDTTNQIQYRGETVFPATGRVDSMDWPIVEGYGVYLVRWRSAVLGFVDLTPHVDFEEGATQLQIGTRSRFPIARVGARTLTRRDKRRIRRRSHQDARLYKFSQSGFFR